MQLHFVIGRTGSDRRILEIFFVVELFTEMTSRNKMDRIANLCVKNGRKVRNNIINIHPLFAKIIGTTT